MSEDDRQPDGRRFKLIFAAIALLHLLLLGTLLFFSVSRSQPKEEIVWVNPGSFGVDTFKTGGAESSSQIAHSSETPGKETSPPTGEAAETASAESSTADGGPTEPLPKPSPHPESLIAQAPTPTSTPRPEHTSKTEPEKLLSQTPGPTPKSTPKPTPKPKSSVTPKPSASPKSTPKPGPASKTKEKDGDSDQTRHTPNAEKPAKTEDVVKSKTRTPDRNNPKVDSDSADSQDHEKERTSKAKKYAENESGGGSRKAEKGGSDGAGSGSSDAALAAYVGILTNRFQTAWNQPTSEMAMGKTMKVTVRLKVEADGKVTEFAIVEGSGNAVVDESVRQAGKTITQLPPPPNNTAFSAPVRFELGN